MEKSTNSFGSAKSHVKLLIFLLILLFSFLSARGVTRNGEDPKRFQITFTVGTSFSNFGGDPLKYINSLNAATGYTFDQKSRIGFPLGCDINFYLKPWFSLKTGVLYAHKGMKVEEAFTGSDYDFTLDVTLIADYLVIPFIIELSTVPAKGSSDARFFINGGVTTGFLTKSEMWTEMGGEYGKAGVAYDQQTDAWNDVNRMDFGYMVGIGCYFKSGLSLSLDYEKGFKSISSAGWDFRNSVFSVKFGYYFTL